MSNYGLCLERLQLLPAKQLRELAEKMTGRLPDSSDEEVLVHRYLIPAIRKAAKAPQEASEAEVLRLGAIRTAEVLGMDTAALTSLSIQQIGERILLRINEEALQQIENMSAVDRDRLQDKLRDRLRTLEEVEAKLESRLRRLPIDAERTRSPTWIPPYYPMYPYHPFTAPNHLGSTSSLWPAALGTGGLTGAGALGGYGRGLSYKSQSRQNDFYRNAGIAVLVVVAAVGAYELGKYLVNKKRERDWQRTKVMAEVILELAFCLAYNPYTVLGLHPTASLLEVKRRFREQLKTVHPDVLGNLPTYERQRALRRCQELIAAYQLIQGTYLGEPQRPEGAEDEPAGPASYSQMDDRVLVKRSK